MGIEEARTAFERGCYEFQDTYMRYARETKKMKDLQDCLKDGIIQEQVFITAECEMNELRHSLCATSEHLKKMNASMAKIINLNDEEIAELADIKRTYKDLLRRSKAFDHVNADELPTDFEESLLVIGDNTNKEKYISKSDPGYGFYVVGRENLHVKEISEN